MGNQLVAMAPSQILPVEQYLQGYVFDIQPLRSTRFMKVVRAKSAPNVSIVAKVFVIPDSKLQPYVDGYKEANKLLTGKILGETSGGKACLGLVGDCCLPFDYVIQDCNFMGRYLTRPFLASNLYDRLSTRPFLSTIERKFIAFQVIVAISRAHAKVVRHGDLKLENVLLTSWNWVQISDFAFFKPVYLLDNNPSSFNFYFDCSRRRTCNIAPERFVSEERGAECLDKDMLMNTEKDKHISLGAKPEFDSTGNHRDLMPSMDIFSLGCVIGQLFTENHLFNLSQLLSYKTGSGYTPEHVINMIPDEGVRKLVWDMIQINPSERKGAEEYLSEYRGTVFPEYFYSFLYNYMRSYACPRSSDRNMVLLSEQYPQICDIMKESDPVDLSNVTLILYPLVLSNLRSLKVCHSKLCALRLIEKMCGHLKSDSILTRVVPSVVHFFKDASSKIVCAAIACLTECLKNVNEVPRSQRKVFVEYIFPDLFQAVFSRSNLTADNSKLTRFSSESVLHKFLQCFPSLVEMSQKFLDLSMVSNADSSQPPNSCVPSEDTGANSTYMLDFSYDEELRCLRSTIGEFYLPLFSKATGVTKQLILESDLIKLCAFHANQPENDPLAQYLPTCASAANYWQLNESYFRNIVKVCAYCGEAFALANVFPFIEQGLHNVEELVIVETLNAIKFLYRMNLINVSKRLDFAAKVRPLLFHPNPWVRLNAAKALSEACASLGPTMARASIYPYVNEYIKHFNPNSVSSSVSLLSAKSDSPRSLQSIEQTYKLFKAKYGLTSVKDPAILLSHIQPMRRFSYEKLCSYNHPIKQLIEYAENLTLVNNAQHESPSESISALEFPDTFTDYDKYLLQALYFEDRDSGKGYDARPDLHKIGILKDHIAARHGNFNHTAEGTAVNRSEIMLPEGTSVIIIKSNIPDPVAFQNQRYRFYEADRQFCKVIKLPTGTSENFSMAPSFLNSDSSKSKLNWDRLKLFGKNSSLCVVERTPVENFANEVLGASYYAESPCLGYLRVLARLWKKNNQKRLEYLAKQREKAALYVVPPWKPNGSYVASLHDHSSAVNELVVSPNHNLFATCSNDGTCRIWNPARWEINHQDPLNASGCVVLKKGAQVKSIAFISNECIIACCHDSLQAIEVDRAAALSNEARDTPWTMGVMRNVGSDYGDIVAMTNFDNIVTVSTTRNYVIGYDRRLSRGQSSQYCFQTKPQEGLITSMVVAENGLCVVLGTSLGRFSVWDLRFLMPVKSFAPHVSTSSAKCKIPAVQKLKRHAFDREAIVASMRGHHEIAVWKLESGSRNKIFWSSPHNPLDYQTNGADNYAMGFYVTGTCDSDLQIISGGTDKRVRLWDLGNTSRSYVISNSIQPPGVEQTFSYSTNRVAISRENTHPYRSNFSSSNSENVSEFVDVIREKVTETCRQAVFRRGPDLPEFSHRDLVTDVNVVVGQTGTSYLVSADMSGVVKVWK